MTVGRLQGCGASIGTRGLSGRCGEVGLCVTCWQKRNDCHVDTLRAERDEARSPGDSAPASPEQQERGVELHPEWDCGDDCPKHGSAPASLTERAERVVEAALPESLREFTMRRAPVTGERYGSFGEIDNQALSRSVVAALADAGLLAPAPTKEEESK